MRRQFYAALLVFLVSTLTAGNDRAYAQAAPSFELSGWVAGRNLRRWDSINGTLDANIIAVSFHWVALKITSPGDLRFEYECEAYNVNTNSGFPIRRYTQGQACPDVQANPGLSRAAHRIRIYLTGPAAPRYRLTYRCWTSSFGQSGATNEQTLGEGEWCGHDLSGNHWFSRIIVSVQPR